MTRTVRRAFFIAPSGRVHGTDKCVASPGRRTMVRERLSKVEWRNASARGDLCWCAKWDDEHG